MLSALLWILAAILEGVAAWVMFGVGVQAAGWLPVVILHIVHAVALAAAAWLLLPLKYRRPLAGGLVYLFCVGLFIPVLGWFGLLLSVLPGLHWPLRAEEEDWREIPTPELPYKAIELDPDAIYRHGGLASVLRFGEESLRMRAVMATRYIGDRRAVPILGIALKDPVDEVRLLAYALLNAKERRIDATVQTLHQEAAALPHGVSGPAARVDEQIAALYLEQAELGLSEGAVAQFVLKQALEHIEAALRQEQTGAREFLKGRICLRLQHLEDAYAAFVAAERLGLSADKVAPYRAEEAFESGEYEQVREQMTRLSRQARNVPLLEPLVEYWT